MTPPKVLSRNQMLAAFQKVSDKFKGKVLYDRGLFREHSSIKILMMKFLRIRRYPYVREALLMKPSGFLSRAKPGVLLFVRLCRMFGSTKGIPRLS
jgi:hypothetical protein